MIDRGQACTHRAHGGLAESEKAADGSIQTNTFRKPGFSPQYLHHASEHPRAQELSIVRGEYHGYMLNSSRAADYDNDVKLLITNLEARGHERRHLLDVVQALPYDSARRAAKN